MARVWGGLTDPSSLPQEMLLRTLVTLTAQLNLTSYYGNPCLMRTPFAKVE